METAEISTSDTYDLRSRVLRPGRALSAVQFPRDAESKHFGVIEGGRVISVVTAHAEDSPLFPGEAGGWRIRGMATDPSWQGKGAGALGLAALLAWGRQNGVPFFWCNARVGAFRFYE
ncbi:MAG: GNAT family N-acetyltransferase, partial [Proteobacteria bacterium]